MPKKGSQSKTLRSISCFSDSVTYGGLLTITSYRSPLPGTYASTSRCTKHTDACNASLLRRAMRRAVSEMSHAVTLASGSILEREMAMQPLPVPMSRIRAPDGTSFSITSTSSSVSGRGNQHAGGHMVGAFQKTGGALHILYRLEITQAGKNGV